MARPLRLTFPGALYHVMARGNARQAIFLDAGDRIRFLDVLARAGDRYRWICLAYCLMDNHYHLVIETPLANLSLAMRHLNGVYAQAFNRRHERCGHVFQGRFRSILVEKEGYLLAACRYVVGNPVRAGLCRSPGEWPWSSYRPTAGLEAAPPFLSVDRLLSEFASARRLAQGRYRSFVDMDDGALDEKVRGERLGTDDFLRQTTALQYVGGEIPHRQLAPLRPSLSEVFESESVPVATAYRGYRYTLREIAEHLGCHYSTVSRRLRREEVGLLRVRECKT